MNWHEAANIFPLDEEHIDELAEDIKANGLLVPIEMLDGQIIDGRRRSMACERAGVEPKTKKVNPDPHNHSNKGTTHASNNNRRRMESQAHQTRAQATRQRSRRDYAAD